MMLASSFPWKEVWVVVIAAVLTALIVKAMPYFFTVVSRAALRTEVTSALNDSNVPTKEDVKKEVQEALEPMKRELSVHLATEEQAAKQRDRIAMDTLKEMRAMRQEKILDHREMWQAIEANRTANEEARAEIERLKGRST